MTALVVAEHDNQTIRGATLNTVSAAAQLGGDTCWWPGTTPVRG